MFHFTCEFVMFTSVCFQELSAKLGSHLVHYGPVDREEYWRVLSEADVALSTAKHEFFGVAM